MRTTPTRSVQAHRVLVVSADMGGGHNATAAALEETVARQWPGSSTLRVDVLDLLGPGIGPLFRSIYVTNVVHTPWLYELFYASLWRHPWFADASKRFTGSWCGRRLAPTIDRFDPDLIVSTYPIASSGLAWLRRYRGLPVPAGAWVSDIAPHPFWVYGDLDANFVMSEAAVAHAHAADPTARVEVSQLPVRNRFVPRARAAARATSHTRLEAYVVVVSCGSYSFGDVTDTVRRLLAADPRVQVVAVCGTNRESRRRLLRLNLPADRLSVRGWERDMPPLVAGADLVVTNAGGATALEAVACGTPIMMYDPIAAHGKANANLMVVAGLAELCSSPDELTGRVHSLVHASPTHDVEPMARTPRRAVPADRTSRVDGLATLAATGVHSRTARAWPMRGEDAFFAHVETEAVPQEPGVICRVASRDDGSQLTPELVCARLTEVAASLPVLRRVRVDRPRHGWWVQPTLDPRRHVTEVRLPVDAADHDEGRTAAMAALQRLWADPLPERVPPWQILLVTGLPDGSTWFGLKMHHAGLDGVSGFGLLERLLEPSDATRLTSRPASAPSDRSRTERARTERVGARLRNVGAIVAGIAGLARSGPAPRHPINREITDRRRRLATWEVSSAELAGVAHTLHAGPHELALCLVADALCQTMVPCGLLRSDRPLRLMVPVTVRSTRLDRYSGNWTGAVPIDVPLTQVGLPLRLQEIRTRLRRQTAQGQPRAAHAVMWVAGRLPRAAHAFVAQRMYGGTFINVLASYIPGPHHRGRLSGHRIEELFPVVPLAPGVPIAAGMVTYAGRTSFGLNLDASLGLTTAQLCEALDHAWAEASDAAARVATAPGPAGVRG